MLFNFTKKLCPLVSLVLMFGCGKKIGEPETTDADSTNETQTPDLPGILTLQMTGEIKNYRLPRNAWFRLPTSLGAVEGDATGKRVKIYYNYLGPEDYEFHCYYSGRSSESLSFQQCESPDGLPTITSSQELSNMEFPMDRNSAVRMELLTPTNYLVIESVYLVDWK